MKLSSVVVAGLCLFMGMSAPLQGAELGAEPTDANAGRDRLSGQLMSQLDVESAPAAYASGSGRFSIQFPGTPESRTRTLPIIDQSYTWNILRLQNESGFYGVAYTDLSSDTIEWGSKALIDSIKNTLTDELNWSALEGYGTSMEVNGYPARELIGTQNNQISVLRLVLADQRLYAIMSSSDNLAEIGQFLDSFAVEPWQPYASEDGRFSVSLPLEPTTETERIELGGREFEWNVLEGRNFTAPDDSYSVGYTSISAADLDAGADELLNRIGAALLERWRAQNVVESGKEVMLAEHPGRSFVGTTEDGQIVAVRFYLVGDRMYAVGALSNNVTNISRFLDSFQVQ